MPLATPASTSVTDTAAYTQLTHQGQHQIGGESRLSATLSATIGTDDAASHTNIDSELQPANAKPDYAIKALTECYTF